MPIWGQQSRERISKEFREKWTEDVCTRKLNIKDAWNDLNARVLKLIQYPPTMTTFTREDCRQIMCPILE